MPNRITRRVSSLSAFRDGQFIGRIPRPNPRHHVFVRYQLASLRLLNSFVYGCQLPTLNRHEIAKGLLNHPRFRSVEYSSDSPDLIVEAAVQSDAYGRRVRHSQIVFLQNARMVPMPAKIKYFPYQAASNNIRTVAGPSILRGLV